ncbi:hypothetical protein [Acidaminobacter sp.]|uniref:hypothetical protein n=1 Tax=Acidaminobacter sp. TaxID=1872102 RepID=UPI0013843F73|nr:hypothetical protein [Acidaminobacter sp.]MDK9710732.1 hypothetical protein [Acidaminobacter sp.]MZQ96677.1 hypothetical protein [Acidaminobacter sp.]
MQQETTRPRRGLALYMSILSAFAIELLTFLEFRHTALFFAVWTVIFALLTIWEIIHETKRSKKPEEGRGESLLPSGQKPISIIDLDQVKEEETKPERPAEASVKGFRLRNRISHLVDLEEYLLVVSFAIISVLNLVLMIGVGAFGLSL